MLRVILIVFLGIVLSACRSGDDVSSTGGKSSSNNIAAFQNQDKSLDQLPLPETPVDEASEQKPVEKANTSEPIFTTQPVTPPEEVEEVSYHPVTVEWSIPAQRENGELLSASELDGYIIEFVDQSNPGTVDQTYVEGGQVNRHSMSLPSGSYRFRVIAVDRDGLTSDPSSWVDTKLS